MTGTGSHTGEGLGAAVKKGVGMFHVSRFIHRPHTALHGILYLSALPSTDSDRGPVKPSAGISMPPWTQLPATARLQRATRTSPLVV